METPGMVEQVFTLRDINVSQIHKYASEVLGDWKSPVLAAHPAQCLQDLENLSVHRDDVKAVVTLYGYIFESKVLTAGKCTGGKKQAGTYNIYSCSCCKARCISVKSGKGKESACNIKICDDAHLPNCGSLYMPVTFDGADFPT